MDRPEWVDSREVFSFPGDLHLDRQPVGGALNTNVFGSPKKMNLEQAKARPCSRWSQILPLVISSLLPNRTQNECAPPTACKGRIAGEKTSDDPFRPILATRYMRR